MRNSKEMVSVRKDILDKLTESINLEVERSGRGEGIYLGDIICAMDELLAGKTYDEVETEK